MRTPTLLALSLATSLLLSQEPAQEEQDPLKPPEWKLGEPAASENPAEDLLGAWMLVDLRATSYELLPDSERGFLLVTPGFLSFEFHAELMDFDDFDEGLIFHTGMHRWRLTDFGNLRTLGMIGTHNLGEMGELGYFEFEPPGEVREFTMSLTPDSLVLGRTDGTAHFTFRRLNTPEDILPARPEEDELLPGISAGEEGDGG